MNETSAGANESFAFVVLNDMHYMSAADRPWLEGIVRQINATEGVELCLMLGDLAENGMLEELVAAKEILGGLRMPYWVVPGNHDGPTGTIRGAAGLVDYERLFPGRRNYLFEHRGWQFVGFDTTDGSAWTNVSLSDEVLAFARDVAERLDRERPVILFTHFPLARGVSFTLLDGGELMKVFAGFRVPIVFSGHYHGLTSVIEGGVEMVTNRCCSVRRTNRDGDTSRGYYVCRAQADGSVAHDYTAYSPAAGEVCIT